MAKKTITLTVTVTNINKETAEEVLNQVVDALTEAEIMAYVEPTE